MPFTWFVVALPIKMSECLKIVSWNLKEKEMCCIQLYDHVSFALIVHILILFQASFLTKKLNIGGKRVNLSIWVRMPVHVISFSVTWQGIYTTIKWSRLKCHASCSLRVHE